MRPWKTPRWQRLLTWALQWWLPSIRRVPTFREAWTGVVHSSWNELAEPFPRVVVDYAAEVERVLCHTGQS
jgi:hypothetical protein